jgi:ferredoxin
MKQQIIDYVSRLLKEERIDGFIALRETDDHVEPHVFTRPEELENLSLGDKDKPGDARYPLVKILTQLQRINPSHTYAVLVRGCDERALHKLYKASQLAKNRVIEVGFTCPPELAEECECVKPYPDVLVVGEELAEQYREEDENKITVTPRNLVKDLQYIKGEMERCLKCYGCRNICPVCFCHECTLEEDTFVPKKGLPPSNPDFLLTRAVHMADFCVYCGLCEQACPADIPLKTIYKVVGNLVNDQFGLSMRSFPGRGEETEEKREEAEAAG